MIGRQGPNICIEIGAPANRRRAEGCVYVLETAFTVQRALCTFEVKVKPCRRPPLSLRNVQTLAPIGLNSKCVKTRPKFTRPPGAGFFTFRSVLARRADINVHVLRNVQTCVCCGGEGPRAEGGRGEETSPDKGFDTPRVGGFRLHSKQY